MIILDITVAVKTVDKTVEGAVIQGVEQIQAASSKMHEDITHHTNKVNEIVQQEFSNAKKTVEHTKADLENKIKESLDKLQHLLGR